MIDAAPTLLAQLSDLHVRVGPRDRDSARALAAAVDAVLALTPRPHAVLVTGDLADDASAREYERCRELLAPLPMPVYALPGNHDDRDAVRAHFAPLDPRDHAGDLVQFSVTVGGLRVVLCDTTMPGRDEGSFGRERRAWLDAELAAEPRVPTIVAMHHPPAVIGLPGLDALGLPPDDRAALAALVARRPQVRRVVAGHVHRTVFDVLGGCGLVIAPSTNIQARLEIGAPDYDLVAEPAAFAVHVLLEGDVVSHIQPVAHPRA